jgi:hypothetical protein
MLVNKKRLVETWPPPAMPGGKAVPARFPLRLLRLTQRPEYLQSLTRFLVYAGDRRCLFGFGEFSIVTYEATPTHA